MPFRATFSLPLLLVAAAPFVRAQTHGCREVPERQHQDFPPIVATNQIFHDRERPSRVTLPVIPRDGSTR